MSWARVRLGFDRLGWVFWRFARATGVGCVVGMFGSVVQMVMDEVVVGLVPGH
jgi:hypothetical protein